MRTSRDMRDAQSDALAFVLALTLTVAAMLAGASALLETAIAPLRPATPGAAALVPQTAVLLVMAMLLGAAIVGRKALARGPFAPASAALALGIGLVGLAVLLDRSGVFGLPLGESVLFLGLFIALRLAMAVWERWFERRSHDRVTGLPTTRALRAALRSSLSARVAAAHIPDLATLSSQLSKAEIAHLTREAARRLSVVSDIEAVHLVGPGLFAWIMHHQAGEDSDTTFEAARALFNAPFPLGDQRIALIPHFGRAPGSIGGAVAAARLAGERSLVWSCNTSAIFDRKAYRARLLGEFDEALASGAIAVLFQPRIALASGAIVGAECLVRWTSPTIGRIAPADFVPTLEAHGRLADLTRFIARCAAARALEIEANGHKVLFSIRLAPSLLRDRRFIEDLCVLLGDLPGGVLALEIEPGWASEEDARLALERLVDLGAQLAITADNAPVGPCTLPIAQIKLGEELARALTGSEEQRRLFRARVAQAHANGLSVVAAGADTLPILTAMGTSGADVAQGWEIGKPMRPDDFDYALACRCAADARVIGAAA